MPRLSRSTVTSRCQRRRIRNELNRANLEYTEQERASQRDRKLYVESRLRRADPAYKENERVLFNDQRSSRRGNSDFREEEQIENSLRRSRRR